VNLSYRPKPEFVRIDEVMNHACNRSHEQRVTISEPVLSDR
jgi:hypothetical protein